MKNELTIRFERRNKETFDSLCDVFGRDTKYDNLVYTGYKGSNLYGDIEIEVIDSDVFVEVLHAIANILSKENES